MKDLRSIAETAANWWANVACGNDTLHRDGTDELPNFFAGLIADELKKSTNDDVKEQFKSKLADAIYETLSTRKTFTLRCDYHPDATLGGIAQECGISEYNFPWKTSMHISAYDSDDSITIYEGQLSDKVTVLLGKE